MMRSGQARYGTMDEDRMRVIGLVATVMMVAGGCAFRIEGLPASSAATGGGPDLAAPPDQADPPSPPPADLAVAAAPPLLTLTTTPVTAAHDVDLTADGPLDWAHWGWDSASDSDHAADGNGLIGGYTPIGTHAPVQYDDNVLGYVWSNGAPPRVSSPTGKHVGIYITGVGNGFQLSLPAGTSARSVRLYVGGFHGRGQLTASLSDGSAPAVGDQSLGSASGKFDGVYQLDYRAASSEQTLSVQWTTLSGDKLCNVTLQAVTLR
jgi:hypothetical protein